MSDRPTLRELELAQPFARRHIGPSEADQAAMLALLGHPSLDALADAAVPASICATVTLPSTCAASTEPRSLDASSPPPPQDASSQAAQASVVSEAQDRMRFMEFPFCLMRLQRLRR